MVFPCSLKPVYKLGSFYFIRFYVCVVERTESLPTDKIRLGSWAKVSIRYESGLRIWPVIGLILELQYLLWAELGLWLGL